jgi:hypothetical protein
MNVRHLRYFVAASEHESFRKAAVALGVQESTISRRIRRAVELQLKRLGHGPRVVHDFCAFLVLLFDPSGDIYRGRKEKAP